MMHYCPGSSKQIEHFICRFANTRRVIAPDYPGNGDSSPARTDHIDIGFMADAVMEVVDALGIDTFDVFGVHTGARVATELAITRAERVRKVILEGFAVYSTRDKDELLDRYLPRKAPDAEATHVMWAWHFVRDTKTWFPWYDRTPRARLAKATLPTADALHEEFVELLKAIRTYHLTYGANFRYVMKDRVPLITQPTMIAFSEEDMVFPYYDDAVALLPACTPTVLPAGGIFKVGDAECDQAVRIMDDFLSS
jgi:pimeloyl-ACP methyl ester carboxylesterase